MTHATQRGLKLAKSNFPMLLIGGVIAALLGIASLAVGRFEVAIGLSLTFGGLGAIAFSFLFQLLSRLAGLLTEIASHLSAIRSQMEKGVLGLLG